MNIVDSNYRQKIDSLKVQVGQYNNSVAPKSYFGSFLPSSSFNLSSSYYFYGLVPIIILILLFLLKPSFLCIESIDDEGTVIKQIQYKSLFVVTLVLSIIVLIGIFGYKYKLKK